MERRFAQQPQRLVHTRYIKFAWCVVPRCIAGASALRRGAQDNAAESETFEALAF